MQRVTETLAYAALGMLIAMVSSMAGIGGGVFMVPLFYLALKEPINIAVGTSKAVIVVISLMSTAIYIRTGKVDMKIGTILLSTMVPGSYLGAFMVSTINPTILEYIVALFILLYAARLIYRVLKNGTKQGLGDKDRHGRNPKIALLAGLLIGVIAGLTGTGGGALVVPLATMFLGLSIHEAVATSMYAMTLAAVVAAIRHYVNGDIDMGIALPFAAGALIGAQIGPRIALRIKPNTLRLVVAVILIIVAVRMLL